MTKYKVVRSYGPDSIGKSTELQSAFDIGYEFVRASEYVPEVTHGGSRRYGYIEYILRKRGRGMTKRDLVEWLEKKKLEAIAKADETREKAITDAKELEYKEIGFDEFLESAIPDIQRFIKKYGEFIDKVNALDGYSMSKYNWHYGYHDFVARFGDIATIRKNIEEVIHLDTERYRKTKYNANSNKRAVESTYYTVIETVKNLPTAKDGLEYLKKLGFDVSEIEPAEKKKQLPATISVNVDTRYLLLNKEKEDAGTRQIDSTDK